MSRAPSVGVPLELRVVAGRVPLDGLEIFEKWVQDYETERERLIGEATTVPDDIKIGIVIAGLHKGVMRDHLMIRSESIATYAEFRKEGENIARAKLIKAVPMELDAFIGYTAAEWEEWCEELSEIAVPEA